MKRSLILILAAVLLLTTALSLTACGSDSSSDSKTATEAPTEAQQGDTAFSEADATFYYKGIAIALDGSVDDILAAIGDADEVKSELSCHGEGEDKTFTYADFLMKSYPKDGKDHVLQVLITKEGVPTTKGIVIGSSLDDVTAAYGPATKTIGTRTVYDAGNGKALRFNINDNQVVQIEYYFDVPA